MHTLIAGDLLLEPLTAAHADEMFIVLSDAEIYGYLDYGPPSSAAQLRERYSRLEARQSPDGSQAWLNWIVRTPGAAPLGYVQATVIQPRTAWIAYVFSSRHWGRGHAFNAVGATMEHLQSAHGVNRFLATVEVENHRSIVLLARLGFGPAAPDQANQHQLSASERLFVR